MDTKGKREGWNELGDWGWQTYTTVSGPSGEEPACQCRKLRGVGSIPGSGRAPGGGTSNPLQCACLENPMDRGAWRATVHRVVKSQTRLKRLSKQHTCIKYITNENLLYSTGNSTQCSVWLKWEGNLKKRECVYIQLITASWWPPCSSVNSPSAQQIPGLGPPTSLCS